MSNKINQNSSNLQDYKFDVSGMDANDFKQIFIKSGIQEIGISSEYLNIQTKYLFRLSKKLSTSKLLNDEQKGDALQIIEGLYSVGLLIVNSGGIDKTNPEELYDEVTHTGLIDNVIDVEHILRLNKLHIYIMQDLAIDELGFTFKEKEYVSEILQRNLALIELLVSSNLNRTQND